MNTMKHVKVLRAVKIATLAHDGQKRKYTGEPYIIHPIRVAEAVSQHTDDPDVVSAAILHDVLEDTSVTYFELHDAFGSYTADMVRELTNFYTSKSFPNLNRRERKLREANRFTLSCEDAQLIRVHDILDNLPNIRKHDPDFFLAYREEKLAMVEGMTKTPYDVVAFLRQELRK